MSKFNNVWVITDKTSSYAELCAGARGLGKSVTLIYAGDKTKAVGADKAYYLGAIDQEHRWNGYIPTIVSLVKENAPEVVVLGITKNCRLTAGTIAATLGTGVITDASAISIENDISAERMVYGGAAIRREKSIGATAVICVANGIFEAAESTPVAEIIELPVAASPVGIKCTAVKSVETSNINLAAAKRIVGVGRGLSDQNSLVTVSKLASVLGAEIGCTRPIVEELKWLPRETYIGVSGVIAKPDLYLAVGISGQVQHSVGISNSNCIIAINKDESAPIFKICDYGIVGDLEKIVPTLTELVMTNK